MHPSWYDPSTRFDALARERTTQTGVNLLRAAQALDEALIEALEEWEDEADAGSLRRPGDFDDARRLFCMTDDVSRLAAAIDYRRNLSYVLADAEV
jgi:hypothetical protein